MKNIKNYSVKFYHIFVAFLFVSLSFQEGFAQGKPIEGNIKLYFETVEKTKAEMDILLDGDSLIYLQVYAKFSPEFTEARLNDTEFGSSTFSWVLCDEAGTLASFSSEDVILLGHINDKCPQGSQDRRDRGAASYAFSQAKGCPSFGHYATISAGGPFVDHIATPSTHIVKMGAIGFKLLSSDGFFVKMANTGPIDQSFTSVIFNIVDGSGSIGWDNSKIYDWGQSGRLDLATVGGVVVKKGFKNKSV